MLSETLLLSTINLLLWRMFQMKKWTILKPTSYCSSNIKCLLMKPAWWFLMIAQGIQGTSNSVGIFSLIHQSNFALFSRVSILNRCHKGEGLVLSSSMMGPETMYEVKPSYFLSVQFLTFNNISLTVPFNSACILIIKKWCKISYN